MEFTFPRELPRRLGLSLPSSVVILVADGARPDTLAAAMDRGDLPALSRLRTEGGLHQVTSVFPSVTGPAYTPFVMGRYPGPVGVPGIRWYDRERTRTRWPVWSRSYVGLDIRAVNGDIPADAPTIFELASSRLASLSVIERGLARSERVADGLGFGLRAGLTHFRGDVAGWLEIDRRLSHIIASRIAREKPQVAFCALTGIDKTSHSAGHDSGYVREAMRIVDATAARIRADAERDGRWESMHLWIVSDHGHSPVKRHEDLAGLLRGNGVPTRAHPWTVGFGHRAAVMVSGNAMSHVYLDLERRERPWWNSLAKKWEWLAAMLLERDSTDLLILPVGPDEVIVRTRARGTARITCSNGRYSYFTDEGDPLGIGAQRDLDDRAAYDATLKSDYPDALVQLVNLCASPRCGDLLISASRDWDLRAKWEPIPHVSSHGALHWEHMMVPLLTNRRPARAPRRTVDLFASAVDALGFVPPRACDGVSWL
jgi:hypothetical protein